MSTKFLYNAVSIPRPTLYKILRTDFGLKPCKPGHMDELNDRYLDAHEAVWKALLLHFPTHGDFPSGTAFMKLSLLRG